MNSTCGACKAWKYWTGGTAAVRGWANRQTGVRRAAARSGALVPIAAVGRLGDLPYTDLGPPFNRLMKLMRSISLFIVMTFALLAAPTGSSAQEKLLTIELNKVQQSQDGCRLSFIAVNKMGANLETTAMEVVFFDANDVVSEMLLLDFGRLPSDKTKVVEFVLQQQQCEQISRVLVNDVVECSSAEEQNMTQDCFNALRTSNRAQIDFGV